MRWTAFSTNQKMDPCKMIGVLHYICTKVVTGTHKLERSVSWGAINIADWQKYSTNRE